MLNYNFDNVSKWSRGKKIVAVVVFLVVVLIFINIVSQSINGSAPASQPEVVVSHPTPVVPSVPVPKTEEQTIGDIATSALQGISISNISYRNVQIESDNYQRPAGSKMATVSFTIASFYDKSSLIHDTGTISSKTFQGVFNENPKMQDAFVWFYGDTTDAYGNKKQDVLLTYTIDRKTFKKINWTNFNQTGLCNFLEQESASDADIGCKTLANIN